MKHINILCLSGSLRTPSYNTAALHAAQALAPKGMALEIFSQMGALPLFNPDRENEMIPAVVALKKAVSHADGMIIASPEYAHGISGVMKNALDWLVSDESFPAMPLALFNTSPRASHALNALREVLKTMSGTIIEPACLTLPLLGSSLGSDSILRNKEMSKSTTDALISLAAGISRQPQIQ